MNMDLATGLSKYKDSGFYDEARALEERAQRLTKLVLSTGGTPEESSLVEAREFLIAVERWKAGCLEQRTGNAKTNTDAAIWAALAGAIRATTDIEKLCSVMQLRGFGSTKDPVTGKRRAKVATSVLRFLLPGKWGVVDWRNAAILSFLDKNHWKFSIALKEAESNAASELRDLFDLINEDEAKALNDRYRTISQQHFALLSRAADVDMALFGISLFAWRMSG